MKTKIEIIQSLLDERKITAQEALTLMATEKEYVSYPVYPSYPITQPYNPNFPYVWGTYDSVTLTDLTIN